MGSTCTPLLFLGFGVGLGWVVNALLLGKRPSTIVQGAGWATGPVWMGVENSVPPGFIPQTV